MPQPDQVPSQPRPPQPRGRAARRRASVGIAVLTVVGSVLTGLLTAAPAQAAVSTAATMWPLSAERAFVSGINAARRASRRPQLATSASLTGVARAWAQSMARSNRLAHNPRVTAQVRSWRYLGENVGVGGSAPSLHQAFLRSAPHRANVVSTRYTQVGVGVAYARGRMWVVELFERPAAGATRAATRTAVPTIGYGSRGALVVRLQRKLRVRPTGYFGPVTLSRVKAFQQRYHLRVTGRLDAPTRRKLGV